MGEEQQRIQIPRIKLGTQGLEVSKLGFGCMGLTGGYSCPVSEEVGISIIKHAFHRGITFFDTSDIYGPKTNEILVGKALKQLPREKVQLATKFGFEKLDSTGIKVNGTPEYVRASIEASLKRLDVDYIDLYYQHRVDTNTPIEDTMSELKKLVKEGKIKYIGLSEASPETIKRAHAVHPISAFQTEWSLYTRDIEDEIVPLCRTIVLTLSFILVFTGTTKIKNLDSNIDSVKVKLTAEDLNEISDAVPINEVAGDVLPERFSQLHWKFGNTPPKGSKVST
ncbi:putative aldo-keto reductase 1 isoform X2 [Gossypium australe]|uniref:Putative aldo-keto reductase 1 isoform X2 n=1 Tax=Gossypium australe TaxID=47621 RepID=A0A5B6VUA8_9ROSI|nr:putative aldo-keto reductase 1 isoform X2 [Gossypium australe]